MSDLVNLTIDDQKISVPKGTTVFAAAKQMGIHIPIFCYHDRMPPFGACRVCLVEVVGQTKLESSCTLEVREGMAIRTQSEPAVGGRETILELLLINHPLDCPVCDRGGECPLQEHAMHHGPGESEFYEEKRHFKKPVPRGPVLMLDRERCIACARCTRFCDEVSGDHALEFIDRGWKTEVGTPDGGPAKSKFIGNTIMICPVGALTSQVYRFRARPWDNDSTPTTCTLCPVGCSMILDARDGAVMRTRARENPKVNDIWLCDKGWFGYEFSHQPERLQKPLLKKLGKLQEVSWDEALSVLAKEIYQSTEERRIAALGGNTLTVEENYLLQLLMRREMGVENLDHRVGDPIFSPDEEGLPPGMAMEIGAISSLSFIVLAGLDLTEEFPVLWLKIKEAMAKGLKVIFIGHYAPEIAPQLTQTIVHPPGSELENISQIGKLGKNGAIFVGRHYLQTRARKQILAELLKYGLPVNVMEGRGNSLGARLAGMHPGLKGLNTIQVLEEAATKGWGVLYAVGADIAKTTPPSLWKEVRKNVRFLAVQDIFMTKTAQDADLVLPTLSFVEKKGHFLNIEGRVLPLLPGKDIPEGIYSDGEIFELLANRLNHPISIGQGFIDQLKQELIAFNRPVAIDAQPLPKKEAEGMLLATFAKALFDQGVRMQHNPHLKQMAPEPFVRIHPSEGVKRGITERARLVANGQSISVKIKLDSGVALGTAVLPLGFYEQVPLQNLGMNLMNGMNLQLEKE